MTSDKSAQSQPTRLRPVVLCILDGWGYRDKLDDNAVTLAHTPVLHRLWKSCPHALLEASEEWVGLPGGQIGNSEVGHMNLGAGRAATVLSSFAKAGSEVELKNLKIPGYGTFIGQISK